MAQQIPFCFSPAFTNGATSFSPWPTTSWGHGATSVPSASEWHYIRLNIRPLSPRVDCPIPLGPSRPRPRRGRPCSVFIPARPRPLIGSAHCIALNQFCSCPPAMRKWRTSDPGCLIAGASAVAVPTQRQTYRCSGRRRHGRWEVVGMGTGKGEPVRRS